jgi:DNA adenine methylase
MAARTAFLRYVGSKNRVMPAIKDALAATGKTLLVDVFGGSGSVIMHTGFRKRIYNDLDDDLVNLFTVMQAPETSRALYRKLRWCPPSRAVFTADYRVYRRGGFSFRLIADPVERARALFYRSCYCFGGKLRSGGFQVSPHGRKEVKEIQRYRNVLRQFSEYANFWRDTVIEHRDFRDMIRSYGQSREAVLFVDPPYDVGQRYYSVPFGRGDLWDLSSALLECKAPSVCTFYDHPDVREFFPRGRWDYSEMCATKNSQKGKARKQKVWEMLLSRKERRIAK